MTCFLSLVVFRCVGSACTQHLICSFFSWSTSLISTETFSQPYRTFINTRGHYAYNNGNGWSIFTGTEKMQIRARGTHGINLSSLRLSCMTRLQSRCWFPEKQEILFRLDLILDYFFVLFFFHQKYVKNLHFFSYGYLLCRYFYILSLQYRKIWHRCWQILIKFVVTIVVILQAYTITFHACRWHLNIAR